MSETHKAINEVYIIESWNRWSIWVSIFLVIKAKALNIHPIIECKPTFFKICWKQNFLFTLMNNYNWETTPALTVCFIHFTWDWFCLTESNHQSFFSLAQDFKKSTITYKYRKAYAKLTNENCNSKRGMHIDSKCTGILHTKAGEFTNNWWYKTEVS